MYWAALCAGPPYALGSLYVLTLHYVLGPFLFKLDVLWRAVGGVCSWHRSTALCGGYYVGAAHGGCYCGSELWRRMTAPNYRAAALWRRRTMTAPHYDGVAPMVALHYGGAVLWRRCSIATLLYGGRVLTAVHYGGGAL